MVATDVMGRGIDVSGISHIINFDIPTFSDDYVHRVGRTGRMGREGIAFTFVTPEEGIELTRIEQRIDRLLIRDEMSDFVLTRPTTLSTGDDQPPEQEKRDVPSLLGRRPAQRRHRRRL
jgi:ATP-dependent RNA helicase DeaD